MDAPLAALLVFEMLDRVGEVRLCAVDSGIIHGLGQKLSGAANKRMTCDRLARPLLLAGESEGRVQGPLAENGMLRTRNERFGSANDGIEGVEARHVA